MSALSFNKFWLIKQNTLKAFSPHAKNQPLILKRNKGFLLRKAITRIGDILEFLFLALLSDPAYLAPLMAVFVFFLTAGFLTEGLYLSSKELAIDKKRHSKTFSLSLLLIINISILVIFYLKFSDKEFGLINLLFIFKFLLFSIQSVSLYKTIDKQSQKRIYVSILKTNIPQILCQIILWGLLMTPLNSQTIFYFGIIGFSIANIFSELIFFFYLTKKESAYQIWKSPLKVFKTITIKESSLFLFAKNGYLIELFLLSFFLSTKYKFNFYYTFFVLISIYRIILRPYRSFLIDLQRVVPKTPYSFHLQFQSLCTGVMILLIGMVIASTSIKITPLVIVTLILFKGLIVTHKRNIKDDLLSILFSVASLSSFYYLQSEIIVCLLFFLSIFYFQKPSSRPKTMKTSQITLIPIDNKIRNSKIDINRMNHNFKSLDVQLEKIILGRYIVIRHAQGISIDEVKYGLSYFIDFKKEERVIHQQKINLKELIWKTTVLKKDDIKIFISNNGETILKKESWSLDEIKLVSNKSRYLDSTLGQLGRKALHRFEGHSYYILKSSDGILVSIAAKSFTDSELEQLDEIKLQSLV